MAFISTTPTSGGITAPRRRGIIFLAIFLAAIAGIFSVSTATAGAAENPTVAINSVTPPGTWSCDVGASVTVNYSVVDPDGDLTAYRIESEGPAGASGDDYTIVDGYAQSAPEGQTLANVADGQATIELPAWSRPGEWLVALRANDSVIDAEPHWDSTATATFDLSPCTSLNPPPPTLTLSNIDVDMTNACTTGVTGTATLTMEANRNDVTQWSVLSSFPDGDDTFVYGSEEYAPEGSTIDSFSREVTFSVPASYPRGTWYLRASLRYGPDDTVVSAEPLTFVIPECDGTATPGPTATAAPGTPTPQPTGGATPEGTPTVQPTTAATAQPTGGAKPTAAPTKTPLAHTGSGSVNTTLVGVTIILAGLTLTSLAYAIHNRRRQD